MLTLMNTLRPILAGLVGTLIAVPTTIAAGPTYIYGNVSGWTVRTDPAQDYRCFAEVQFEGGTLIRLGFDSADSHLSVSVSDPSWPVLADGAEHSVQLAFDGKASLDATATGTLINSDLQIRGIRLSIPAQAHASFISDFKARHSLEISIDGARSLDLSLAGSYRATQMLEDCQDEMARVIPASG